MIATLDFHSALGSGSPSVVIGVNISGQEYAHESYPTAVDLDYLKGKGFEVIRLPISWERMQPTLSSPIAQTELTSLKAFIAQAAARGMEVIVDLHNYGAYSTNLEDAGNNVGQKIGSSAVPISAFANFWQQLAAGLKDVPGVAGYDIMNEPHDMGGKWPAIAQAAVDAIRGTDMKTAIFVEGDGWANAEFWAQRNSNLDIKDPANNVIYEAHQYFDADASSNYAQSYDEMGAYPNIGVDRIKPFLQWLKDHNARGFVGEFGVPDNDARWLTVVDNFLKAIDSAGVSGAYWTYHSHNEGYYFNPTHISPLVVGGADRAQMAVLVVHENVYIDPLFAPAYADNSGVTIVGTKRADLVDATHAPSDQPLPTDGSDGIAGGAKNDRLSGLDGKDWIRGNGGNDVLKGGSGNDVLDGGAGKNKLIGGAGNDVFVFAHTSKDNVKISDFQAGHDVMVWDHSVFKALAAGALDPSNFQIGSGAKDSSDHIIYNAKNGALYYDSDGHGGQAAIEIGLLSKHLPLSAADFWVV
jgi:hypothetical protein